MALSPTHATPPRKSDSCCWAYPLRRLLAVMYAGRPRVVSDGTMKKRTSKIEAASRPDADEILPEYDFSKASRNRIASRYAAGSSVVVLEPDVAAAFPSSDEANAALRALAAIIQRHRARRPAARRDA